MMRPRVFSGPAMTLVALIIASGALCAPTDPSGNPRSAYQQVVEATDELLAIAESAREYYGQEPERYYAQIDDAVGRLVDIERFTRGIMATYASVRRYRALNSEAEKQAFLARIDRFGEILRRSLIITYAKVLIGFEATRVETQPPPEDDPQEDYARIEQKIYDDAGQPHRTQYYLHRDGGGNWRLYNITVDGINIGHIFRSQFADAVEKHGGDVDRAIDQWEEEMHPVADSGNSP